MPKYDFTRKTEWFWHLKKLPNNVGILGKIIVATGFEWLPKVQKIAQSGHTGSQQQPILPLKHGAL